MEKAASKLDNVIKDYLSVAPEKSETLDTEKLLETEILQNGKLGFCADGFYCSRCMHKIWLCRC